MFASFVVMSFICSCDFVFLESPLVWKTNRQIQYECVCVWTSKTPVAQCLFHLQEVTAIAATFLQRTAQILQQEEARMTGQGGDFIMRTLPQ